MNLRFSWKICSGKTLERMFVAFFCQSNIKSTEKQIWSGFRLLYHCCDCLPKSLIDSWNALITGVSVSNLILRTGLNNVSYAQHLYELNWSTHLTFKYKSKNIFINKAPGFDSDTDKFSKMWLDLHLGCSRIPQKLKNFAKNFVEDIICKIMSIWMNSRERDHAAGVVFVLTFWYLFWAVKTQLLNAL